VELNEFHVNVKSMFYIRVFLSLFTATVLHYVQLSRAISVCLSVCLSVRLFVCPIVTL